MFKYLAKLLFITILISLFAASPLFLRANDQKKPNNNDVNNAEEYEKHLEGLKTELMKFSIQIMIKTPMREGRDKTGFASGFALSKEENQTEDYSGRVIKYVTYYVFTVPHVVGEKQGDLEDYQKDNVRIFILGKNDEIQARIVAWEWGSASMLLRVDIPESRLDNFKIHLVNIAEELPVSSGDSRYSDKEKEVDTVFFSGYPGGELVANPGYIFRYRFDYRVNEYAYLVKVATANTEGWGGPGQSGAGVFNRNKELIGVVFGGPQYGGMNYTVVIPIDVIVERFLKNLPELDMLDLPNFDLEERIKYRPVYLSRPKDEDNNSNN